MPAALSQIQLWMQTLIRLVRSNFYKEATRLYNPRTGLHEIHAVYPDDTICPKVEGKYADQRQADDIVELINYQATLTPATNPEEN